MILKYIVHQVNVKEYMCVVYTSMNMCVFMHQITDGNQSYMCICMPVHTCTLVSVYLKTERTSYFKAIPDFFLRKSTIPV